MLERYHVNKSLSILLGAIAFWLAGRNAPVARWASTFLKNQGFMHLSTRVGEDTLKRGTTNLTVGGLPFFGQSNTDWRATGRVDFARPGQNPFLTPKETPLKSLSDVRQRIEAYDKKTTGDHFLESTAPWLARSLAGEFGNTLFSLPENNTLYASLPETLKGWKDTHISYEAIFGIQKSVLEKPVQMSWFSFLTNKIVQSKYKEKVQQNFSGRTFNPIHPFKYLKHVVMQYNLMRLADDLAKGRVIPAAAKSFGIGSLIYDVVKNTRIHYLNAKALEDGNLKSALNTLLKTACSGVKEAVKSIAAWEVGSIGFLLGYATICIGTIPSLIAGCIAGGVLEAGFKSLFKYEQPSLHPQYPYKPQVQSQHVQQQASHFEQTCLNFQA